MCLCNYSECVDWGTIRASNRPHNAHGKWETYRFYPVRANSRSARATSMIAVEADRRKKPIRQKEISHFRIHVCIPAAQNWTIGRWLEHIPLTLHHSLRGGNSSWPRAG